MDDNKTGWKVLERVKAKKKKEQESLAKEPSEAERLFSLFFPGFQH
jgi:hypothetical protein